VETRSGLLVFGAVAWRRLAFDGAGIGHAGCWIPERTTSVTTLHALTIVRLEAHTRCVESEFRTLATAERTARGGGEDGVMMRRMRPWRWQIC
jgi:hypothetical protein